MVQAVLDGKLIRNIEDAQYLEHLYLTLLTFHLCYRLWWISTIRKGLPAGYQSRQPCLARKSLYRSCQSRFQLARSALGSIVCIICFYWKKQTSRDHPGQAGEPNYYAAATLKLWKSKLPSMHMLWICGTLAS